MLEAISPIDGRYNGKTESLVKYFSEYALIKYRVIVEIEYLKHLVENKIGVMAGFPQDKLSLLDKIVSDFSIQDGLSLIHI